MGCLRIMVFIVTRKSVYVTYEPRSLEYTTDRRNQNVWTLSDRLVVYWTAKFQIPNGLKTREEKQNILFHLPSFFSFITGTAFCCTLGRKLLPTEEKLILVSHLYVGFHLKTIYER